jgi:hypothetical protein
MYTKEQIRAAVNQVTCNTNAIAKTEFYDMVLQELERVSNLGNPYYSYLQPISVNIVSSKFDSMGAWGRRQIYLDLQVQVIARNESGLISDVFSYPDICQRIIDGMISISSLNNRDANEGSDSYLMPIAVYNKIIKEKNTICLDVISCGDMSKYINGNLHINELLIKASILDGSLVIKAK